MGSLAFQVSPPSPPNVLNVVRKGLGKLELDTQHLGKFNDISAGTAVIGSPILAI
jgi:hypothetical protein